MTLSRQYLGNKTPGFEGILNGGVYHIHKDLGVHEAVLFGEYFFVEALDKALTWLDKAPTPAQVVTPTRRTRCRTGRVRWQDGPTEEDLPAPTEAQS